MTYRRPGSFHTPRTRFAGRAAVRAGLLALMVAPIFVLAIIVRYAVLLTVLPMLVFNVAYAGVPVVSWLAERMLGGEGTVVAALALCMTLGSLGLYALVGVMVAREAITPVEEPAGARALWVPLAAVVVLCLLFGIGDFWLGSLETVYANLMADLQYYGAVEEEPWIPLSVLPALEQAHHPERFVFETNDGNQIELDTGALLAGVRLGGWLQVIAFGLLPGSLFGFAVGNGIRRAFELIDKPS